MRLLSHILAAAVFLLLSEAGDLHADDFINHAAIYRKAAPAVVYIHAFLHEGGAQAGTGSIISRDGRVLTCRHVIWEDVRKAPAMRIMVFLKPDHVTGRSEDDLKLQYDAVLVAESEALDLALLKITNPPAGLPVLELGDSDEVEIGAPTVAIGHPEQGVRWTLTTGAVSGEMLDHEGVKGRDVFQMETAINRGNSGGPLLDHKARLIGVNEAMARVGAGGVAITGIQFALKSNSAAAWLEEKGVSSSVPAKNNETAPRSKSAVKTEKYKSALPSGKEYTESDLAKMKGELNDMADEFEKEFERVKKKRIY